MYFVHYLALNCCQISWCPCPHWKRTESRWNYLALLGSSLEDYIYVLSFNLMEYHLEQSSGVRRMVVAFVLQTPKEQLLWPQRLFVWFWEVAKSGVVGHELRDKRLLQMSRLARFHDPFLWQVDKIPIIIREEVVFQIRF